MNANVIHQEVMLNSSPGRIYEALLDSSKFSALSGGAPANISRDVGGAFSCFGGMIAGRNVELKPNERIVQAWRAGNWPEGVYSVVKFELKPEGAATKLIFDQTGIPEGEEEHLQAGWSKMYWEPLKNYLR